MKRRLAAVAVAAGGLVLGVVGLLPDAGAQRLDPRRPKVFVVGAPGGASPMVRVDGRRSGVAKEPLPDGTLRLAWSKSLGTSIEQAALSGADGSLALVTTRGDVVFLDADGAEVSHVTVGAGSVGLAVMTSDGTVVFPTSTGDVIGVKRTLGRPKFTARLGGERNLRAAPLALDDGGVVLATGSDLVVLDSEGNVRSRTNVPEPPAAPLIASGDKVLAISGSGSVFGWVPGREVVRVGSFGAAIDGGAALSDAGTLLAVIEGNHLVELDVAHGTRTTRAVAAQGLYLGPPSVRRGPAGVLATVLALTPTRGFVVTVDPGGQELLRAPIASMSPQSFPDGGPMPLVAPPHVGPLVDARGAIAFAATDGHVGVVTAEGAVETLGEPICATAGSRTAGVAGLTPYARSSFVVTCTDRGVVARIDGPDVARSRSGSAAKP